MALTDILDKLGGQQGSIAAISKLFGASDLQGIVSAMHQNGLGQQVKSWIGNGPNQPISSADVKKMADPQMLAKLAKQQNMSPDQLAEHIAQALPHVVDKATPDGQVPKQGGAPKRNSAAKQGSATDSMAGMLKKK